MLPLTSNSSESRLADNVKLLQLYHTVPQVIQLFFLFQDHCCILYSIVGWNCVIGTWSRIEGTKFEPNPNEPHARLASESLFQKNGRLIASTTVLGEKRRLIQSSLLYVDL